MLYDITRYPLSGENLPAEVASSYGRYTSRAAVSAARGGLLARFLLQTGDGMHRPYVPAFMPRMVSGDKFGITATTELLMAMSSHPEWRTGRFLFRDEVIRYGLSVDRTDPVYIDAPTESGLDYVYNLDQTDFAEKNPDVYQTLVDAEVPVRSTGTELDVFRESMQSVRRTTASLESLIRSNSEDADRYDVLVCALGCFLAETLHGVPMDELRTALAPDRKRVSEALDYFIDPEGIKLQEAWKVISKSARVYREGITLGGSDFSASVDRYLSCNYSMTRTQERSSETYEQLQETIRPWRERLGLDIHLIRSKEELPASEKEQYEYLEKLEQGKVKYAPSGWYNNGTGEVYFYAPYCTSAKVEELVLHEVVAHKGLPELLGAEGFDILCDLTWKDVMTDEDRARKVMYIARHLPEYRETLTPKTRFSDLPENMQAALMDDVRVRRSAANEYIADLAQKGVAKVEWNLRMASFIEAVKKVFQKFGIRFHIDRTDLQNLLSASMARMAHNAEVKAQGRPVSGGLGVNFMMTEVEDGDRDVTVDESESFARLAHDFETGRPGSAEALNGYMNALPLSVVRTINITDRKNGCAVLDRMCTDFPFQAEGRDFGSMEQYLQYSKAVYAARSAENALVRTANEKEIVRLSQAKQKNEALAMQLLSTSSPEECRRLGRKISVDRGTWEKISAMVQSQGLRAQAAANSDMLQAVLNTGDAELKYPDDPRYAEALVRLRSENTAREDGRISANRISCWWNDVEQGEKVSVAELVAGEGWSFHDDYQNRAIVDRDEVAECVRSLRQDPQVGGMVAALNEYNRQQSEHQYAELRNIRGTDAEGIAAFIAGIPDFEQTSRAMFAENVSLKEDGVMQALLSVEDISSDGGKAVRDTWPSLTPFEKAGLYEAYTRMTVDGWWESMSPDAKRDLADNRLPDIFDYTVDMKMLGADIKQYREKLAENEEALGKSPENAELVSRHQEMLAKIDGMEGRLNEFSSRSAAAADIFFGGLTPEYRRQIYAAGGPQEEFSNRNIDADSILSKRVTNEQAAKVLESLFNHIKDNDAVLCRTAAAYHEDHSYSGVHRPSTYEEASPAERLDRYITSVFPERADEFPVLFGMTSMEYAAFCAANANSLEVPGSREQAIRLWNALPQESRIAMFMDVAPVLAERTRVREESFRTASELMAQPHRCVLNSGGALGSDYFWGHRAEAYGIEVNHFYTGERNEKNAPYGNVEISAEDFEEGRKESAAAAAYNYGYKYETMKDGRLIRDWSQVKHSDAVMAVGTILHDGDRMFPRIPSDTRVALHECVSGGTGYAVTMAILHGKPVYVFDQDVRLWYEYNHGTGHFEKIAPREYKIGGRTFHRPAVPPTDYLNIAGIGTRELNEHGRKAIAAYMKIYAEDHHLAVKPEYARKADTGLEKTPAEKAQEWWEGLDDGRMLSVYPFTRRNELTMPSTLIREAGFPAPVYLEEDAQVVDTIRDYADDKYMHSYLEAIGKGRSMKFLDKLDDTATAKAFADADAEIEPVLSLGYGIVPAGAVYTDDGGNVLPTPGETDWNSLVFDVARNLHERYCEDRIRDGWTYGSVVTDNRAQRTVRVREADGYTIRTEYIDVDVKYDPTLIFFESLTEGQRTPYMERAAQIVDAIEANGYYVTSDGMTREVGRKVPDIHGMIRQANLQEAQRWWESLSEDRRVRTYERYQPEARKETAEDETLGKKDGIADTFAFNHDSVAEYASQQELVIADVSPRNRKMVKDPIKGERQEYVNEVVERTAREIGGICTLRTNDKFHYGNPFVLLSTVGGKNGYVLVKNAKEAVERFVKWIHKEADLDVQPERRDWIIRQVESGALDNKPLVYYTTKAPDNSFGTDHYSRNIAPNHAHALQDFILEHIRREQQRRRDDSFDNGAEDEKAAKKETTSEVTAKDEARGRIHIEKPGLTIEQMKAKYGAAHSLNICDGTASVLGRYLNPAYPHKNIPVYNSSPLTAASVLGIWEGLKSFRDDPFVSEATMDNATMKGIRREGELVGIRDGVYSRCFLDEKEAFDKIFVPAYKWMLENTFGGRKAVEAINEVLDRGLDVVIVSDDDRTASLVRDYVNGVYPEVGEQLGSKVKYTPVGEPSEGYQLVRDDRGLYNHLDIRTGQITDSLWCTSAGPVVNGYIAFEAGPEDNRSDGMGTWNFKTPEGKTISDEWFSYIIGDRFKEGVAMVMRTRDNQKENPIETMFMGPHALNLNGELSGVTPALKEEWDVRSVSVEPDAGIEEESFDKKFYWSTPNRRVADDAGNILMGSGRINDTEAVRKTDIQVAREAVKKANVAARREARLQQMKGGHSK